MKRKKELYKSGKREMLNVFEYCQMTGLCKMDVYALIKLGKIHAVRCKDLILIPVTINL